MKRFLTILLLALALLSAAGLPAFGLTAAAGHIHYAESGDPALALYAAPGYLNDTLTLAGRGLAERKSFTLAELEELAYAADLGYEHTYSLLTRGDVFTRPLLTGLKALDFLVWAGLKEDLPDQTPVRFIAKDGYAVTLTLKQLRTGFSSYATAAALQAEATGLPVLLSFGANGLPLVGPTGMEPVYRVFSEADGFSAPADNGGGPLRLTIGQSFAGDYNAPNNVKWLAAVVVGDPEGYAYSRVVDQSAAQGHVPAGGDWTHHQPGYRDYRSLTLTIGGSEAEPAVLTLAELEALDGLVIRDYFAASGGRNAYEGLSLKRLLSAYLAEGVDKPTSVTVIARDGYAISLNVDDLWDGVASFYQPGEQREIILAYAVDGAPLVPDAASPGYTGGNAYGPLRLVVENTVSQWVKDVDRIVVGEAEAVPAPSALSWPERLSLLTALTPRLLQTLLTQE